MKLKIYSIMDKKVAYKAPFFQASRPQAIRSFTNALKTPEAGEMFTNPADFALYEIGEFDDETGQIVSYSPTIIMDGLSITAESVSTESENN